VLLVLSKSASLFHPLVIRGKLHSHVLALPFERGHTFLAKIIGRHTLAWHGRWLGSLLSLSPGKLFCPTKGISVIQILPKTLGKRRPHLSRLSLETLSLVALGRRLLPGTR